MTDHTFTPVVRPAERADVAEIHELIVELAVYEKEPDAVKATPERLEQLLFDGDTDATGASRPPAVYAFVVDAEPGSRRRIDGYALWFLSYSTWEGTHGIWLEDLYVREARRGHGLGTALLKELAQTATARGYKRVEWTVLKWNTPSIGFYESIGAFPMSEWDTFRLTGDALSAFSGS